MRDKNKKHKHVKNDHWLNESVLVLQRGNIQRVGSVQNADF
jgi:hypothetical protein